MYIIIFILGVIVGWGITVKIDTATIQNLNQRISNLEFEVRELRMEINNESNGGVIPNE